MNPIQQLFAQGGLGMFGPAEYETLRKALADGHDVGGTSQTGAGAFKIEDLDNTIAVLTEQERHIVYLKDLAHMPATGTTVEFGRRTALAAEHGPFISEGELPTEGNDVYDRATALVKYLGTVRSVTMQAQMTRHVVSPMQEAVEAGSMFVMRALERYLFKGNSKLGLAGAEFDEFDGLETVIETAHASTGVHVSNLWGRALEEEDLRDAGQTIIDYHGNATDIYIPFTAAEDLAKSFLRHYMHTPRDQRGSGALDVGFSLNKLNTLGGTYMFKPIYLYRGLTREQPVSAASSRAPSPAPTVTIAISVTGTGQWEDSLDIATAADSGSVEYKVALGNKYGESTAVVSAPASQAISYANRVNSVAVTVTNPAGGYINAPKYASIYRRDTDADGNVSDWGCVKRISLTSVTGGATGVTFTDNGEDMPGTYRCWVIQRETPIIRLDELMPISRIPLPREGFADRFAIAAFVTPVYRDPYKLTMIKNIGRRTI